MRFSNLFLSEENQKKFEQIYNLHREFMYNIAYHILNNQEDAEDVVQESFMLVAINLEKIENPSSPMARSYIARITKNKAIDFYRKKGKIKSKLSLEDITEIQMYERNEPPIWDAILRLPERYREVILLRYHFGYSNHEISSYMNISEENTKKLIQRAKAKLYVTCTEDDIL